jgi:hypothetical protein
VLAGVAPNSPPLVGVPPKPPNAGAAGLAPAAPGVPNAKPVLAPNAPVLAAGVDAAPKGLEPAAAAAAVAADLLSVRAAAQTAGRTKQTTHNTQQFEDMYTLNHKTREQRVSVDLTPHDTAHHLVCQRQGCLCPIGAGSRRQNQQQHETAKQQTQHRNTSNHRTDRKGSVSPGVPKAGVLVPPNGLAADGAPNAGVLAPPNSPPPELAAPNVEPPPNADGVAAIESKHCGIQGSKSSTALVRARTLRVEFHVGHLSSIKPPPDADGVEALSRRMHRRR